MGDPAILKAAIVGLVIFLVVALIAVAILAHIIATGMYAAEREERAEAGEPVGDWPHLVSYGPLRAGAPPPASVEIERGIWTRPDQAGRMSALLADARARLRGENLDGSPRRETVPERAADLPPSALVREDGAPAPGGGKTTRDNLSAEIEAAFDALGVTPARWPAADPSARWAV